VRRASFVNGLRLSPLMRESAVDELLEDIARQARNAARSTVGRVLSYVAAMGTEWFIGTIRDEPPNERGTVADLAVEITEEEHRALREAERVIREAEGGLLFRLVFANHRALQDCEARMLELLTQPGRRGFGWLPELQLNITLALANWLTS